MNGSARVAALVPARAGSRGIPNKNLAMLGGRTLVQWAVDLVHATPEIDRCIVSTDGDRIAAEAERLGAEVHHRGTDLASDNALVVDTVADVASWHRGTGDGCDQFVLLQPTSPFRVPTDIRRCLEALSGGSDSAATFGTARVHPRRLFIVEKDCPRPYDRGPFPWEPRQHFSPALYELNGCVYALWIDRLPMESRSLLFGNVAAIRTDGPLIDIDDERDLVVARALLEMGTVQSVERIG